MTGNIESRVDFLDYSSTNEFVRTFSQLLKILRWVGIPWGGSKTQKWLSNTLVISIFIGILCAVNRLFIDHMIGKIFLRVAGTTKYASAFFALLMIKRLRRLWPIISSSWTSSNYCLGAVISPEKNLRKRILRTAAMFMVFFPLERLLIILVSSSFRTAPSLSEFLKNFITESFNYLLSTDQYTHIFGVIIFIQMLITTLISNLQDFIVIAFSLGLSSRQKTINGILNYLCEMDSFKNHIKDSSPINITAGKHLNWRRIREVFMQHSNLVEQVDEAIGPIVILCLFTNLLYILMILFSLNYKTDKYLIVYNVYALVWLCIRSLTLLLTASDVHKLSLRGLDSLKIVKTTSYSIEVRRLQLQLSKNEIALSGMGFFKLKRSLILKVLSVIVTYDLILLQYNGELNEK